MNVTLGLFESVEGTRIEIFDFIVTLMFNLKKNKIEIIHYDIIRPNLLKSSCFNDFIDRNSQDPVCSMLFDEIFR